MKSKSLVSLTLIASVMVTGGCASSSKNIEKVEVNKPEISALEELRDISVEARDELRILAKLQESKHSQSLTKEQHAQKHYQATAIPEGFEKQVTFAYTGPAHKVADVVAKLAGYVIEYDGVPPAVEPWVRINLKNEPINEGLKELGAQTGEAVIIEIHQASKVMRFKYQ